MAVTLFQSALQKLTVDQPFYDHLVHNLLLSYELLIKQLLKQGDTSTALDFLRAALRLEIRGSMAEDAMFLRKFAGAFQSLGIVFFQSSLNEAEPPVLSESDLGLSQPRLLRQSDKFAGRNRTDGQTFRFHERDNAGAAGTASFYCLRAEECLNISQESSGESDGLPRPLHCLCSRPKRTRDLHAHSARVSSSGYRYTAALPGIRRECSPDAGFRHSSGGAGSQYLRFRDEPA